MKKEIPEIINTALELDNNLLKEFFELHQKESGLKPEFFFGLLKVEIKERRKKLNIDFSRIDDEDYQYKIINSYQGNDYTGYLRLASGLYILEEFINKQLIFFQGTDENSSGTIWTPESDCKDSDVAENFFNTMPLEMAISHFSPLMVEKNKSGVVWMEKHDFDLFIKRSICKQSHLPKPKINIGYGGKYAIIKLFHNFYSKSLKNDYSVDRKKDLYVELLKDAFDIPVFNNLSNDDFKGGKSEYKKW